MLNYWREYHCMYISDGIKSSLSKHFLTRAGVFSSEEPTERGSLVRWITPCISVIRVHDTLEIVWWGITATESNKKKKRFSLFKFSKNLKTHQKYIFSSTLNSTKIIYSYLLKYWIYLKLKSIEMFAVAMNRKANIFLRSIFSPFHSVRFHPKKSLNYVLIRCNGHSGSTG